MPTLGGRRHAASCFLLPELQSPPGSLLARANNVFPPCPPLLNVDQQWLKVSDSIRPPSAVSLRLPLPRSRQLCLSDSFTRFFCFFQAIFAGFLLHSMATRGPPTSPLLLLPLYEPLDFNMASNQRAVPMFRARPGSCDATAGEGGRGGDAGVRVR